MNKKPPSILTLALALVAVCFCSLSTSACAAAASDTGQKKAPALSFNLTDGACIESADGEYAVCWNPLFETYTLRATAGGLSYRLAHDQRTNTWRATLPDGSAAVYANGKLAVEPPLPPPPK